jgi:DNA-binding LacI/PurR family transcriptional regulator
VRDQGLRVPDDMAITSIDNIELACMVRPALTTVSVPRYDMGLSAIQLLMSQRDFPLLQRASMLLPIELIVRDSCGARKTGGAKDQCE